MGEKRLRGFGRTAAVLATVLVATGTMLVAGPPAAGQDQAFPVGSGRSEAKFLKVGPSRGALTLAPQVGLALSDFLNTRGRGDVRTVDFAALEDSVPAEVRDALPTVKVESTEEGSEEGKTTSIGSPPEVPVKVAAAELHADAGSAPYGASSFKAGSVDIGIGTVVGGRAEARSGVVNGNIREAVARVVIPRLELAEGAVVLQNLEWTAINRTGAAQTEEANFSLGAVSIAGQTFSPPAGSEQPLKDVATALRPVLAPLGIEITFPTPRIENGVVELSPLRLRVADSEVGAATNPVLEAIQPGREALVGAIRGGSEDVDAAILLSDVALGVLAGGSTLDLDIGGVRAFTSEPAAGFSFGSFDLGATPTPPIAGGPVDTGSGTSSDARAPIASVGSTGQGAADKGASRLTELAAVPTSSLTSTRGGPLLLVGLLGLGAAAVSAAADYRKIRTGARLIPRRT